MGWPRSPRSPRSPPAPNPPRTCRRGLGDESRASVAARGHGPAGGEGAPLRAISVISAQAGAGTPVLPVIIAAVVLAAVALLAAMDLIARRRRRAPPEPTPNEHPKTLPDEQPETPRHEPSPAATASPDQLEHRARNVPGRREPVIDRTSLLAAIGRRLRAGSPVVLAPGEGRA